MNPDDLIRRRAKKIVNSGGSVTNAIPLAHLTETIIVNDNLEALTEAVKSIPSVVIPESVEISNLQEYPSEMAISNLPEVQKVEVTNFPVYPEQKAPIVNIPAPKVTVNIPDVIVPPFEMPQVNLEGLESTMTNISDTLEMMRTHSEKKGNREMVMQNHGYSSVNIKNNAGVLVNPATKELQQKQIDVWTDSARFDAFSRLRVSNPTNLFSVSCQYGAATVQMERGNTGTGVIPTHNANTRLVALSCTAGSGTSYMQSFQYIPYQPGKSQEIAVTFVIGTAVAGAVFEAGYFDSLNGIFFRQNGTTGLEIVRRSSTSGSPVDVAVSQSSWNVDKLDGTGASGITLDITKCQILFIDLQFLGMGRVRVGFDIDGVIVYAHEFLNSNSLDVNYMQSGTLPVQILLTTTSTATTKTSYFKCTAVHAEGGFEEDRAYQFTTPEGTVTAANGARTHILSIRPKTTYNGIVNRESLILGPIEQLVTGNAPIYWEIVIGATFSVAPTWADINTASSAFEYGVGGTYSGLGTGAIVIASGYCTASAQVRGVVTTAVNSKYPCSLDRAGNVRANGTYSLLVSGIGGTSATRATFNYKEIR